MNQVFTELLVTDVSNNGR